MATITPVGAGSDGLRHTARLTGYTQTTPRGVVYVEVQRDDNGIFEMVPASWVRE